MAWKLAFQEHKITGQSLIEKFEIGKRCGYDAIVLRGQGDFALEKRIDELKAARDAGVVMPSVCVDMDHFIGDLDPALRRDAIDNLKSQITTIVEVGGMGVITPASYGKYTANLPPYRPPRATEESRAILLEALRELGEHADSVGGYLFLEPLNRYEDFMVNTLSQAIELCETAGPRSLKVVADFYHMNIEEANLPLALKTAKDRLGLIDLSDSNRYPPGEGHIVWPDVFQALKDIDYDGFMTLEGRLQGEPETALTNAASYIRKQWKTLHK